ncbi:hypothetical protein N644_0786 [Lactiplantibacillus paraplantarum]|nr:hypothetical protein N644_0786 [Lactiplantibacillus paraplantarum]
MNGRLTWSNWSLDSLIREPQLNVKLLMALTGWHIFNYE